MIDFFRKNWFLIALLGVIIWFVAPQATLIATLFGFAWTVDETRIILTAGVIGAPLSFLLIDRVLGPKHPVKKKSGRSITRVVVEAVWFLAIATIACVGLYAFSQFMEISGTGMAAGSFGHEKNWIPGYMGISAVMLAIFFVLWHNRPAK